MKMTKRKARPRPRPLIFEVTGHRSPSKPLVLHVAGADDTEARRKGVDLYTQDRGEPPAFCEIRLLFRLDA